MTRPGLVTNFILLPIVSLALAASIAGFFAKDYYREAEFLNYRLATNINQGAGLVYNAGDQTLPILSPALPYILSLGVNAPRQFSQGLSIISYIASSLILYRMFNRQYRNEAAALTAVLIWLLAWPLWAGLGSQYGAALLLLLVSFEAAHHNYTRLSKLSQGLAGLFQIIAVFPGLLAWVLYQPARKSLIALSLLLSPVMIWIGYAIISYKDISIASYQTGWGWQDWLWLLLILTSIIWLLQSKKLSDRYIWLLAIWVISDLMAQIIWFKRLPRLHNPAAAIPVAYAVGHLLEQTGIIKRTLIKLTCFGLSLAILSTLRTPQHVEHDLERGKTINVPSNASLAHFMSDALIYEIDGFAGAVYAFEGGHSTHLSEFNRRNDVLSALILYSPDYLYFHPEQNSHFSNSLSRYYTQTNTPNLWQRSFSPGEFTPTQPTTISYTRETQLIDYALDRRRLQPGDVLRLRIDWQLVRAPELEAGIIITLLDFDGNPVATERRILPPETWKDLKFTTAHAIQIDQNAATGLARLFVALEYRAGNMGSYPIVNVLIAEPVTPGRVDQSPIAALGPISLVEKELTVGDKTLHIETIWRAELQMAIDYQVFLHLLAQDGDGQPIAQADGPPSEGRFPTSFWVKGELIRDHRTLNLESIPPGTYVLRLGFYDEVGLRLLGTDGSDSISLGNVIISDEKGILVDTLSPTE